ncbi:MAG: alpha-glucosidase [Candidatus Enteromonas sp.]|nr:alpha-glucosidase [Candidatus Enteromonas sp.]
MRKTYWWRDCVGYILYPQTFQDSNGDGVGDLPGIISRLDYLHDLGVNLLWICPIFASPMDDNGYDVSDYYQVNPLYGTNDDLKRLLDEAHKRGIRICLDFVMNHTSDEHPWFQKAISDPASEERGYYYIRKGRYEGGKLLPPNNWKGFFATSAWERIGESDEFYLHIFSKKMPDVNWANPKLRERYYEIARYYLDLGVDGFRLDALAHLGKDQTFSDSCYPPDANGLVMDTSKFSNRDDVFVYLQEFKERVLDHYDCLTIGEVGGGCTPDMALRYASIDHGPIDMVFNFDNSWSNGAFGSIDKKDEEIVTDVVGLKRAFLRWYDRCHQYVDMPVYWDNHDHPRVLSQYGSLRYRNESAKALLTILLFMYGTPWIYNGEEIGMSNVTYDSLEDFCGDVGNVNDIAEKRKLGYSDEQILHYLCRCSRTNARTPFPWDNSEFAGFSTVPPRTKLNSNYKEGVNALDEMNDPWSIINYAQYAIWKRRDPAIQELMKGQLIFLEIENPDVFAFLHESPSGKLIVVANMRDHDVRFPFYYSVEDCYLHNYGEAILKDHVFTLRPFECFLFKA